MANPRKTFSKIYDKYINKIYRFIFLKVSSQEIAEDLCSEVFTRGWESLKKGQKIENPQAFLYQIARNLVIDHYREKGRYKTVSADYVEMADPRLALEEKAFLNSDVDNIKLALSDINENYREIIVWRYLDELSVPEIAKMLDKSETAVRVTLHRALKSLKTRVT